MKLKQLEDPKLTAWLLRIGLAFVFLYAGITSLQHPFEWIGYMPAFMVKIVPALTLIKFFAIYELILTVWVLSGWYVRYAALVCVATLGGIVLADPSQLLTTFRDVGLFFMALALVFLPSEPPVAATSESKK